MSAVQTSTPSITHKELFNQLSRQCKTINQQNKALDSRIKEISQKGFDKLSKAPLSTELSTYEGWVNDHLDKYKEFKEFNKPTLKKANVHKKSNTINKILHAKTTYHQKLTHLITNKTRFSKIVSQLPNTPTSFSSSSSSSSLLSTSHIDLKEHKGTKTTSPKTQKVQKTAIKTSKIARHKKPGSLEFTKRENERLAKFIKSDRFPRAIDPPRQKNLLHLSTVFAPGSKDKSSDSENETDFTDPKGLATYNAHKTIASAFEGMNFDHSDETPTPLRSPRTPSARGRSPLNTPEYTPLPGHSPRSDDESNFNWNFSTVDNESKDSENGDTVWSQPFTSENPQDGPASPAASDDPLNGIVLSSSWRFSPTSPFSPTPILVPPPDENFRIVTDTPKTPKADAELKDGYNDQEMAPVYVYDGSRSKPAKNEDDPSDALQDQTPKPSSSSLEAFDGLVSLEDEAQKAAAYQKSVLTPEPQQTDNSATEELGEAPPDQHQDGLPSNEQEDSHAVPSSPNQMKNEEPIRSLDDEEAAAQASAQQESKQSSAEAECSERVEELNTESTTEHEDVEHKEEEVNSPQPQKEENAEESIPSRPDDEFVNVQLAENDQEGSPVSQIEEGKQNEPQRAESEDTVLPTATWGYQQVNQEEDSSNSSSSEQSTAPATDTPPQGLFNRAWSYVWGSKK